MGRPFVPAVLAALAALPAGAPPARDGGSFSGEALLERPEVVKARRLCDEGRVEPELTGPDADRYKVGKGYKNIGDCLWGEIPEEERKAILEGIAEEAGGDAPLGPTVTEGFEAPLSPMERRAVDALREHYKKKLSEALGKAAREGQTVFLGVEAIYDLYEQRVGKNVVEAATSFCMEADLDDSGRVKISETRDGRLAARKRNLSGLTVLGAQEPVEAYGPWNECIVSIAPACHDGKAVDAYTKERACRVLQYLHALKRTLEATDGTRRSLSRLRSGAVVGDLDAHVYTGRAPGQVNVNEATTVTSGSLAEGRHQEESLEIGRAREECEENEDSPRCREFLVEAREDGTKPGEERLAAFALETKARNEAMKTRIEKTPEEELDRLIAEELGRMGVPEEGREAWLAKRFGAEAARKDVLAALTQKRHGTERAELIKGIRRRLRESGPDGDGSIQALGEALAARAEEYRQLVHFNNVVSSFLAVVSEEGTGRNTASLALELEEDAFAGLPDRGPDGGPDGGTGARGLADDAYRTDEALRKLKGGLPADGDVPVLKADQVNVFLGGVGGDPSMEADRDEGPAGDATRE